jgi:GDP-mannose pyrophosphatase NudK
MLIETCAGKLDDQDPAEAIKREIEEETGYKVTDVQKVFEAYMSPGSLMELVHFYFAEYTPEMKVDDGGGVEDEQEEIEVLEMPLSRAVQMISTCEIRDAKTIMLLQYAALHYKELR